MAGHPVSAFGTRGDLPDPHPDDGVIRPGDAVRALQDRDPRDGQTGLVMEVYSSGRAKVRWTTLDETVIAVDSLSRIIRPGE